MRSIASVLFLGVAALWASGCAADGWGGDPLDGDTTAAPDPLVCNGICVDTPPATFTGPSLFWLGNFELAPPCPPEAPFQGLQGFILDSAPIELARECRVTPSDLCETEGLTCAPLPREDFRLCIHRDKSDADCTATGYVERSDMQEVESKESVTLCCQELASPG